MTPAPVGGATAPAITGTSIPEPVEERELLFG